jgi:hypothetical protein
MPAECNSALFEFLPVEGRAVVASFDSGAITSDAGALAGRRRNEIREVTHQYECRLIALFMVPLSFVPRPRGAISS